MGDGLLGVEGVAEAGREKGGRIATFPAEDGELLVGRMADLLGLDLGAAYGLLVCLCSAEVDWRMGLLKGGVAAVEVFLDALGIEEADVF